MSPLRLVSGFFLRLTLAYGAFLALWLLIGPAYGSAFRSAAGAAFRKFGHEGLVKFVPRKASHPLWDSVIEMGNIRTRQVADLPFGTKYLGYAPTIMLACLVLATPVSWSRRLLALATGLVLIHVFIGLGLYFMLLDNFSSGPPLGMYSFGPWVKQTVAFLQGTFTQSTTTRYAVPTVFWILVTIRGRDLEQWVAVILGGPRGESGESIVPSDGNRETEAGSDASSSRRRRTR